jgi:hypothetical protein
MSLSDFTSFPAHVEVFFSEFSARKCFCPQSVSQQVSLAAARRVKHSKHFVSTQTGVKKRVATEQEESKRDVIESVSLF